MSKIKKIAVSIYNLMTPLNTRPKKLITAKSCSRNLKKQKKGVNNAINTPERPTVKEITLKGCLFP